MFCERCGTEIPKGAKFCEKCGAPVEPELQEQKEGVSHKKWLIGGIIGGIVIVAVAVGLIFVTGIFHGREETVQTSTGGGREFDTGGTNATAQPTEQPTEQPVGQSAVAPVVTPSPTTEPIVAPLESGEPVGATEQQVPDASYTDENLTIVRTPEETYKQYIETFVEAVNTGDTGELSEVMSGKVYKQQCDLVENYYKRGIREKIQSYSVTSIKQVNDSRTKVNAKETIEVFYGDGSSKVVKQKYSYVCEYINSMWVITSMKDME